MFEFNQVRRFAFPHDKYTPPEVVKGLLHLVITGDIPVELRHPELNPAFGGVSKPTTVVPMPEAAVDQEGELSAGQNYVGSAWKVSPMKPETQSQPVQYSTDGDLGSGVPLPDPRHHSASLWRDWRIRRLAVRRRGL
jgi:hypothetical protein